MRAAGGDAGVAILSKMALISLIDKKQARRSLRRACFLLQPG
jgi:hypothetical protein